MLVRLNGGLVAFKTHILSCSCGIVTEGNKGSLENQKALKAAHSSGPYCPLDFRHIRRSTSISQYQLPVLCGLGKVLREPSLGVNFLQCVGWRLWTGLTQSLGCN